MSGMFAQENAMKTVLLLALTGVVAGMVACAAPSGAEALDAATSGDDVWGDDAQVLDDESLWQDVPAPPPATTLSAVDVKPVEGGVLVHLTADGVIGDTESFVIDNPDRLVIDLLGMASTVKVDRIKSDSEMVSRIRIGAHADKVRIVMDGGSEAMGFKGKQIMPASDGLWVAVGEGDVVASALFDALDASDMAWAATQNAAAAAPLEVVEVEDREVETLGEERVEAVELADVSEVVAVQEDAAVAQAPEVLNVAGKIPVTVFGIEYETDLEEGVERIEVVASGATSHDWLAPDAETVVVRISNAVMSEEARASIVTREGGPLSLISAFEQPEVDPSEVRVVVKRTAHLTPEISTVGSSLIIEFPIDAAMEEGNVVAMASEVIEMEAAVVAEVATLDPTAPTMPVVEDLTSARELPRVEQVPMAAPIAPVASTPASIAPPVDMPPAALEPPAAIEVLQEGGLIDGKDYRGRRISLDFKDVAISDVLRLIAEVSDLNIISGDEVSGNVSIRLVDVPWDQALDVILLTKGLGFVRVGNVLRIAPSDVLAQEEEIRLQERRAKEKLEDLVVKLIPVNYGDVKDMAGLVKRLLTSRGSVNVDARTSTLIVKDIPSVIDETTALVAAVDTETPQVMIEAKIVEANLDFARELGSVWSVGKQQLTDGFDSSSAVKDNIGGDGFRLAPSAFRSLGQSNNTSFLNSITAQPTALFNLSAFLLDDTFNIDVQLQAAESTGNGKVVSSPRIVTLDNRPAEVQQGVSIPFQTFENGDAKLEFIDAVLSLEVTPHITSDKSIIMEIEVTRDAPDASIPTQTGSPAIAKNQAKTETLVKDSQTLVLGGIYTVDKTFRQSRVPYLHRIPLVGTAFKSKEVSDTRKELLIFVTPRIVVQPSEEG